MNNSLLSTINTLPFNHCLPLTVPPLCLLSLVVEKTCQRNSSTVLCYSMLLYFVLILLLSWHWKFFLPHLSCCTRAQYLNLMMIESKFDYPHYKPRLIVRSIHCSATHVVTIIVVTCFISLVFCRWKLLASLERLAC